MPTENLDVALSVATAEHETALQVEAACKANHADASAAHAAAIADRDALAGRLAAGETIADADMAVVNRRVAESASNIELHGASVGAAQGATARKRVAQQKAVWRLAEAAATASFEPEGQSYLALADATDAWWAALKATQSVIAARVEAHQHAALQRQLLQGPRIVGYEHTIAPDSVARLSSVLPAAVLDAVRYGHFTNSDFRKLGAEYLARAKQP
jgi:hypothetical protein